jgi:glycosyltransferase involved in cell wall biosynthesis
MRNRKILLIGPCPPPYGGVSIHIKRLKPLLANRFDVDLIDEARVKKDNIFNIRSLKIGLYLRKMLSADIVHIHSGLLSLRLVHYLTAGVFFKKRIITIHGYEPGRGLLERMLDKLMLIFCSKTIFVSAEIAERFNVKRFMVKDAFLPPNVNEEEAIPDLVREWISDRHAKGFKICSANAWRLDSHNNEDMYGLDLCIMAAEEIKRKNINVAFVFVVCEDTGVIKLEKYRQLIKALALENNFLLYEAPLSFIRLIQETEIVLRPTNTDGDALTVREALYLGKMVIASDVVKRPEGTTLFKNRDAVSLANTIVEAIYTAKQSVEGVKNIDTYAEYYYNHIYN